MFIKGNVIYLNSSLNTYHLGLRGDINNLFKVFTTQELQLLDTNNITKIRINLNEYIKECFIRYITDISIFNYNDMNIVIFSWKV